VIKLVTSLFRLYLADALIPASSMVFASFFNTCGSGKFTTEKLYSVYYKGVEGSVSLDCKLQAVFNLPDGKCSSSGNTGPN
jgi:hypothetical protein